MRSSLTKTGFLVALLAISCGRRPEIALEPSPVETTSSTIAIENLTQQIDQARGESGVVDLLLMRARFLADYEALDRASTVAEGRFASGRDLLVRARARAAVHRFADALSDVDAAERDGAPAAQADPLRASILVAIGRATEVTAQLEQNVRRHPDFASWSALAGAYAARGRLADADRLYARALGSLETSLPFPYAWICFARGVMWSEQGHDRARATRLYTDALRYVPEFVAANMHLAEIEVAQGDTNAATARLERLVRSSGEPEALALLGAVHLRAGDTLRGSREIARAKERFEALLAQHPLAFADHGTEFFLGPGADAARAWQLAQVNLANRHTPRAVALAIRAAVASGHPTAALALSGE